MRPALEILTGILNPCSCGEAYQSRGLTAPDCFWCEYHLDIEEAMREYAKEALKEAADKAVVNEAYTNLGLEGLRFDGYIVYKDSITNIPLP